MYNSLQTSKNNLFANKNGEEINCKENYHRKEVDIYEMITKTTLSYPDEPNNRRYRFEIKSITYKMTHLEKNQYKEERIYMRGVLRKMKT